MDQYTDDQIIEGIYRKDKSVVDWLYKKQFGRIQNFILNRGGDIETVKDVFQEAMLIVYSKIRDRGLKLTCSFSTYFFAICRNLWFHELRMRNRAGSDFMVHEHMVQEPAEQQEMQSELVELIKYHFNNLSEDCKKVLELHFKRKTLTDICMILGYKDVKYTADRKYRCKKSLFNRVVNDPKYKTLTNGLY